MENIKENLLYLFVFLLPWQTVFLVREIFVGGEKWQYGTIGVYASDVVLVFLLLLSGFDFFYFIFKEGAIKNIHHLVRKFDGNFCVIERNPSSNSSPLKRVGGLDFSNLKTLFKIAIIFLLWVAVSVFWADDKILAMYFFVKILLGVGLFFAVQKNKIDFRKLIFVLIFSAAAHSGLGVWQYLNQDSFSSKWLGISEHIASQGGTSVVENESGRWLRAYGGFGHPNILGGFLVIVLVLSVGIALRRNASFYCFERNPSSNSSPLKRAGGPDFSNTKSGSLLLNFKIKIFDYRLLILITSCSMIIIGILFSFSRSAWLALIVGMIIWTVQKLKTKNSFKKLLATNHKLLIANKKMTAILFLAMLFVGVIITINRENFSSRFDSGARLEKKSVNDRVEYILEAKDVIKNNFFVGAGAGNYTLEVMRNDNLQSPIWKYQPVHNVFLLVFSELGLIGFILFILILIQILVRANPVFYSVFGALLVLMIFDHWLWTGHFGILLLWFILGMS